MASGKIQLTPSELLAQSAEMTALQQEIDSIFGSVSGTLLKINDSWSQLLANNFIGKINSAKNATRNIVDLLGQGAEAARTSATTFENIDSLMAKSILGESGGSGAFGGGESGGGGIRTSADNQSFWSKQWEELKESWKEAGYATDWLEKQYNKVPKEIRDKLESTFPTESAAVKIADDILNNDISLDTLETYLKEIGASNAEISAILNTFKVLFDENSLTLRANEKSNEYVDVAAQNLIDGDIGGFCTNFVKGFVTGFGGGVLGGVVDVGTEVVAGFADVTLNKVFNLTDMIGHIIPGRTGEFICNVSDAGISLTHKFTSWISDLL